MAVVESLRINLCYGIVSSAATWYCNTPGWKLAKFSCRRTGTQNPGNFMRYALTDRWKGSNCSYCGYAQGGNKPTSGIQPDVR